jgi:hypothetical protein
MNPMDLMLYLGAALIWSSVGVLTNELMFAWYRKKTGSVEYTQPMEVVASILAGPFMILLATFVILINRGK